MARDKSRRNSLLEGLQNGNLKNVQIVSSGGDKINKVQDVGKQKTQKPLGECRKAVFRQHLMVALGNTGVLGGGMAVAIPSVTLAQLTNPLEKYFLTPSEASWFSSINTMACPIGGLLVGYLLDHVGRKSTIFIMNIIGIIGWALLATSPLQTSQEAMYIQMLIARFISGLMIGLCVSPVGVYSAEISLPKIRGRLILGTSLGLASGILLMYILGYFIRNNWQMIAIISCAYQILSAICVLPMPDSPSWLMQKGRDQEAKRSLKYFRGLHKNDDGHYDEFETEFNQMKKTAEMNNGNGGTKKQQSFFRALKEPEVYKPLLIMIGFFGFQQCSGIVVVVVFAVQIAILAGVLIDPVLCAVLVGCARLVATFFMGVIIEKWGRRPAGMISATGMSICMLLLAASSWFPILKQTMPLMPPLCLVLHIVFSTFGLLTLPFLMTSEVYPQKVRGAAAGATMFFGLMFSFGVLKIYPNMVEWMGTENVFAFYGGVSLAAVVYIYFLIPETKGRTLLEIEEHFRSGKRSWESGKNHSNQHQIEAEIEMMEVFVKK